MTIDLSFTEQGQGQPIVILHGLFGSKRNWGTVAKALAKDYRVFCLDLRNHGESPWADGMTYAALAADVARFIYHHGIEPCTLIGHSMGGKAAMMLALRKPALVCRLVVVDISPVPRETDIGAYIQVLADVPLTSCKTRNDVEEHLAHTVTNPGVRQFLLQNLVRRDNVFCWRLNLSAIDAGLKDICDFQPLAQDICYQGPTQFIIGGKSDYVLAHHLATIKTLFPKTTTSTINKAGHWVHAEAPDEFLASVTSFLDTT